MLLQLRGIEKRYPGVSALQDANLRIDRGECLGLLGENGAGKSTLMRILSGAEIPDSGETLIDGTSANITSPRDAIAAGVAMIHQEVSLVDELTVAENILLGSEPCSLGIVKRKDSIAFTEKALEKVGGRFDPRTLVGRLSVAEKQLVEIARALSRDAKIVIMDEPTSALTHRESERLFDVIRSLIAGGVGVIYITHRLEEIQGLCGRIEILRDGKNVFSGSSGELSPAQIVKLMVGREISQQFPKRNFAGGEELLRVEYLTTRERRVRNASLSVCAGEIVGIAGLVGSGRTELLRAIFGADKVSAGDVFFLKKRFIPEPRDAVRKGIGLLTEDRKLQGLALDLSILDNSILAALPALSSASIVNDSRAATLVREQQENLNIRARSLHQLAKQLSGGTQQKVVLSKWLLADCKLFIFDEPTRGIDVGAKAEIYKLMDELARSGAGILMASSELQEIVGLCDRIYVMRRGEICGELPKGATQEDVMALAFDV